MNKTVIKNTLSLLALKRFPCVPQISTQSPSYGSECESIKEALSKVRVVHAETMRSGCSDKAAREEGVKQTKHHKLIKESS